MKHLIALTLVQLCRMMKLRPRHWKSSAVDDTFGASAGALFQEKGAPLDEADVASLEKATLAKTWELCEALGDPEGDDRYFIPSDEGVDVRDEQSIWYAEMRRPTLPVHILSPMHVEKAHILSNQDNVLNIERLSAVLQRRKDLPVAAPFGPTRSSYFHSGVKNDLEGYQVDTILNTPFGNFDYRPRVYPKKGNAGITGGPAMRCIWDAPAYAFDSVVKDLFEKKILLRQLNISPDRAIKIGQMDGYTVIMRHGETVYNACYNYYKAVKTGICHYWAEIDLMGSGPTNGSAQVRDQALFVLISDMNNPNHRHVRMLFADHLIKANPALGGLTEAELDKLLKLILSPLQYGAGVPGTYNGLTGQQWDAEIEVDWELFVDVNKTLLKMYPDEAGDGNAFAEAIHDLAKFLYKEYCKCFRNLKKTMDVVTKRYFQMLKDGTIPSYTSYSGQVNYGPVVKRKSSDHWAETTVRDCNGKKRAFKAKVSDKEVDPKEIKGLAFSWFLHGIDAEIITLFTIKAHEAGIPHFTNHDAVFIPLWAWDIAQAIMAECIITVNAHKVFEGWGVDMVGTSDCHFETDTPEVLV